MYVHKNGIMLVKIEEEDLFLLKELKDESWFGTHNVSIINMHDQKNWFNSLNPSKEIIFKAKKSDTLEDIGLYKISNIDWINRKYHSAHDVFKNHRCKGFGKQILEAGVDFGFEILNMNRIDTEVLENNIASLKIAYYVGFIQEGIKRKCIYKCNEYLDSICLGILKKDWEKLERVTNYNNLCNVSYILKKEKK